MYRLLRPDHEGLQGPRAPLEHSYRMEFRWLAVPGWVEVDLGLENGRLIADAGGGSRHTLDAVPSFRRSCVGVVDVK